MKKQSQLGLVIEGKATSSAVLQLPKLAEDLGPVKSTTKGTARRLSNMLRAGHAVDHYEDLQTASLILLRVPDQSVRRVVEDLCHSELAMKDLAFVLCESWLGLEALEPLALRGAGTGTLMNLPTVRRGWFAVEGSARAVRQTRRFLERNGARSDELKANSKHSLFVSEIMATALPMPMLLSAQQALRASGFSGNVLARLLEQMLLKALQDFLRGSRGVWGGPLNECSPEISGGHLDHFRESSPRLSKLLDEQIDQARQAMNLGRTL